MEAGFGSQQLAAICGKLAAFLLENGLPRILTWSKQGIRSAGIIPALVSALCLGGCWSNLHDIDAKVDRLLAQRSGQIDGGAIPPHRSFPTPDLPPRRDLSNWHPSTNNPPAEAMRFSAAPADRDYAAKLRSLQQEGPSQQVELDLTALWRQAQKTGREYLSAEEDYIVSGIRLLIERHMWSPQLFASTSVGFDQAQVDGNVSSVLDVMNQAGVRQQLPFGGEAEAKWIWNATENLRSSATEQYRQSSALVLDATIPLLRGAGEVAQETRIQAERDLVYAARNFEDFRRTYLVSLARDYFNLLLQLDGVASTERQLENLRAIRDRQKALYDAGRVAEFRVNLAENDVLAAESDLARANDLVVLSLDRLRVRLGLDDRARIALKPFELTVRSPDVTLDEATAMALAYRLDLQNRRDQLDDSKRAVRNSMNRLLPDLSLTGTLTLPTDTDAREGGVVYEPDDVQYRAAMTMEWPLDRENERLQLRSSIISLQQSQRDYEKFRDDLVIDVRQKVRAIELAELNLDLADKRVKINERRKEEQDIKADEVDAQSQVDTANALRDSERSRDQAKADLRNSVLDYLLATATLRVNPDGTFKRLEGMQDPAAATTR